MSDDLISLNIDEAKACGMGRKADCCIFLVVGRGFECARGTGLELVLLARQRTMSAQRVPIDPIPDCRVEAHA